MNTEIHPDNRPTVVLPPAPPPSRERLLANGLRRLAANALAGRLADADVEILAAVVRVLESPIDGEGEEI